MKLKINSKKIGKRYLNTKTLVQNSSNLFIKILLFAFWGLLAFLLITEEFEIFHLPEFLRYAAGITLALLHIYNKKYCKCDGDDWCVD